MTRQLEESAAEHLQNAQQLLAFGDTEGARRRILWALLAIREGNFSPSHLGAT